VNIRLLQIIFAISISLQTTAQDLGQILCPAQGDTVLNGELLIVFRIATNMNIKPPTLDVLIDNTSYKYLMKVKGNKVSVLLTSSIGTGKKELVFRATGKNKKVYEARCIFHIQRLGKYRKTHPGYINSSDLVKINLDVQGKTGFSEIKGDGAALRQEPATTHEFRLKGNFEHPRWRVPVNIYLTNHERTNLQPRNRFSVGFLTSFAGLSIGDVNPHYHRIILYGTRIRGAEAYLKSRNVKLSAIYGWINKPVEGLRKYYNSLEDPSFPPVNLQDIRYDTTGLFFEGSYNEAGIYQRNALAIRLEAGSANTRNKVHFVFFKATDDTTSIEFGGQAAQNLVFGLDVETMNKTRNFRINTGIAMSLTTRDIRNGAAHKDTLESIFGVELPADPGKFRNLIIYNSTTTQISFKHTPLLSFYFKPEYRFGKQRITAEVRRIGSAFYSFGNPYLINDRFIASISGRILILKNRLYLNTRYRHYHNNLCKIDSLTRHTDMIDASFNYLIKTNLPRVNGGFRKYFRTGWVDPGKKYPEYEVTNYFAGLIYNLDKWDINSTVVVNFNQNLRDYYDRRISTSSIYANLSQDYSFGLMCNLQYNYVLLTNDTSNFGKNNTYGIRLGYHTKEHKLQFSIGAMQIHSVETDFFPESERYLLYANVSYELLENLQIKIEAGQSAYTELDVEGRNYEETWGRIGVKYRFKK